MAKMLVKVKQGVDVIGAQRRRDVGVSLQPVAVTSAIFPGCHGVTLNHDIGVLAADAILR